MVEGKIHGPYRFEQSITSVEVYLEVLPTGRDFPEDRPYENGNYINQCSFCDKTFVGHKRRMCCKLCEVAPTSKSGENKCLSPEV